MGGRGSSSGKGGGSGAGGSDSNGGRALEVSFDGQSTKYYFSEKNGINYYQRGLSGIPEPTPLNISAKEFSERVAKNGATVRKISAAEQRADEKAYKARRKEMNDFLNNNDINDKTRRRDSRMNRISDTSDRAKRPKRTVAHLYTHAFVV